MFYQIAVWCTNHCFCSGVQSRAARMEKEKGGALTRSCLSPQMSVCLGAASHSTFAASPPGAPSCPLYLGPPTQISASLSRSIHGRRVWMWIEQQIRSVLIMPLKRGLWEHLSLALSPNGRFPGSWSPPPPLYPSLPSWHCCSASKPAAKTAPQKECKKFTYCPCSGS